MKFIGKLLFKTHFTVTSTLVFLQQLLPAPLLPHLQRRQPAQVFHPHQPTSPLEMDSPRQQLRFESEKSENDRCHAAFTIHWARMHHEWYWGELTFDVTEGSLTKLVQCKNFFSKPLFFALLMFFFIQRSSVSISLYLLETDEANPPPSYFNWS